MRKVMAVDQRAEIGIHADQDSTVVVCDFKHCPVARIGTERPGLEKILTTVEEPIGEPAAGTAIDQESQDSATATPARLS